jgi:hypothetical protein
MTGHPEAAPGTFRVRGALTTGRHTGPVERLSRREGAELYLKGLRALNGKSALERRGTVGDMDRTPTWPVAAGSLAAGFAVAQATGVRPLGGVVLLAGAGWCAVRWRERAGTGRAAALVGLYVAAFAGSHGLAHVIGAWPSVAVVAAVVGGAAYALADARPSGTPGPGPRPAGPAAAAER